MNARILGLLLLTFFTASGSILAQSYSGDARKIGMGGIGYSENITAKMIEDERDYHAIVVPLGLIQLLQDRKRFDPDDDSFDPVLGMEYAANPLHFIIGRDPGGARGRFVHDVVEGELNRDLNAYRGFTPTNNLLAEGLASPSWGKTFKFGRRPDGSYQGFFVGVGPYLSAKTNLKIDKGLTDILGSSTNVVIQQDDYFITDETVGQLALSVTGGYRARFSLGGKKAKGASGRDGIYVGVNYHYLKGFRYEDTRMTVQFETDPDGLVTESPTTDPAIVDYYNSRSGSGFALDFGIGAVVQRWEFGFGVNGVGNRIKWKDLTLKQFRLESLFEGGEFVDERLPVEESNPKIELPVEYIGNVSYHLKKWSVSAELSNGFQGTGFRGGVEYRLGPIDLRGGGRYGLERWHPSGGIGFNLGKSFSIDVAAFGTTTNIERQLKPGIAISLRFNRHSKKS